MGLIILLIVFWALSLVYFQTNKHHWRLWGCAVIGFTAIEFMLTIQPGGSTYPLWFIIISTLCRLFIGIQAIKYSLKAGAAKRTATQS